MAARESRVKTTNRIISNVIENIKRLTKDDNGITHKRFCELVILMEIAKSLAVIADCLKGENNEEI